MAEAYLDIGTVDDHLISPALGLVKLAGCDNMPRRRTKPRPRHSPRHSRHSHEIASPDT